VVRRPPGIRRPGVSILFEWSTLKQSVSGKTGRLKPLTALLLFAASFVVAGPAVALAPSAGCESAGVNIPPSLPGAVSGHEFAQRVAGLEGAARDAEVQRELLAGHLPRSLRHLAPVTLNGRSAAGAPVAITLCVMPDYLAVGSDDDSLLVPMGLPTALQVAAHYGFILPTPRMVDAIYDAATVKLAPEPLPAGNQMRTTEYVVRHNLMISQQRAAQGAPQGALTAGDKKDLVLTDRLLRVPGHVAIYGWHRASHDPIQPLSTVHGAGYADYSHGVRLVSRTVFVNGTMRSIDDVLTDPDLAGLLVRNEEPVDFDAQGLVSVLQQRKPR
jgi:hypothetical protein